MNWSSWRGRRNLAAWCILAAASGCAPQLSDTISADRSGSLAEPQGAEKIPALMRVAESTAKAGDFGTAIRLYRQAHLLDRTRVGPLLGLGRMLAAVGAYNESAETFKTVLSLDSNNFDALHGLGNALIAMDQPSASITVFETALQRKEDPRTFAGLGVAFDMLGEHKMAQSFYRMGLKLEPDNLNLMNNLGLSLAFEGDFTQGISILNKASVDPRATRRHRLNLALAYGLAGNNEAAARVASFEIDAESVRNNLAYYETLRAMKSSKNRVRGVFAGVGFAVDGAR
jgi:Flp pilus assembly protein TadD